MMNRIGNNEYFSLPPLNGHEGAGMVTEAEIDYFAQRDAFVKQEEELAFDSKCRAKSSEKEKLVDRILHNARREDESIIYNREREREDYHGQKHPSYPGDHFLSNVKLINKTKAFKIISKMPKGAHLHIHFNSCLSPAVLLDIAKGMDEENFGNLFTASYEPGQAMKFSAFREQFPKCYREFEVDQWLLNKLLFEEQEAHHPFQTTTGEKKTIDNSGIVEMIIQEVEKFQKRASFSGLKIIYCVPRSLAPVEIEEALAECLAFKERWPKWIA
ncbi:adenosine amp deaminase, partial [Trichoderma arundinaceum]